MITPASYLDTADMSLRQSTTKINSKKQPVSYSGQDSQLITSFKIHEVKPQRNKKSNSPYIEQCRFLSPVFKTGIAVNRNSLRG
jgi:hypothetical protein